ncbi:MAG: ATP-dependent Clp protease adaptor ClpS [Saprospiraceae bacterium]
MGVFTEYAEEVLVEEETGTSSFIVVYNDDYNTFDWVIECFMEILGHTEAQSEQLALMVHFKGRASVKEGSMDVLKPLKDSLTERGLSAVIEHEKQKS